ncbi:MCE family protein [Nonomuraea sp. NBC_01738]|uniref:MCE family protein n=1 Tax=Nonomuraea sp. NBC_01738 TaxID=2976003 RepID=UPI002E0D59A3|nr:MCE family protein [Nonomuraea sp. NBC_01738]
MREVTGPLIKSIIFVVVTVLATALLAVSVANSDLGDRTSYRARFTDVAGLNLGDSIRIAGVRVGQVDAIRIVDRRLAEVEFSVEEGRKIPATATATIKYLNLVGQRYIDMAQGEGSTTGILSAGATIPLDRTTPAINMTELFRGFQPLMQALSPDDVNKLSGELIQVLQGEGTTVEGLLRTVGDLTGTLAAKDELIGEVVTNLNAVLTTVNARDKELTTLVVTLRKLMKGLAADREPIGEAIGALGDLTTSTAGLLADSREPLRRDIAQLGRLTNNLNADSPLLERFLQRLPDKEGLIARAASYGSWFNLYLCEAAISGVTYSDGRTAPTGIPITQARCKQ